MTDAGPACWTVLVPVKRLALAKTRLAPALPLGPGGPTRAELALALATDAVSAALACAAVARVLVITSDPVAGPALAARGASVVPDLPEAGLDAALRHAAERARADDPGTGLAALSADLPALSPAALGAALDAAGASARAVVPDAAGTGTVLLTAGPGADLRPAYGVGSLARHVALGAARVDGAAPALRRDVDTPADLVAAARIGVGPATAALLPRLAVPPVSRRTVAGVQGTVSEFHPGDGGRVLLDDGTPLEFDAAAFATSGLRLLRSGQRVRLEVAGQGDERRVTALTIATLPLPGRPPPGPAGT